MNYNINYKNCLRKSGLLLLVLLLLSLYTCPSVLAASEYKITEPELIELETIFNKLASNNVKSKQELKTLKTALIESNNQSIVLKNEIKMLREQLITLESISNQQKNSLARANQSLDEYAKEQKTKLRRAKAERNVAIFAAVIMLGAAMR